MSIINEALKKTQTIRKIISQPPHSKTSDSKPSFISITPKQKKWHIIIILEILIFIGVLGILSYNTPPLSAQRANKQLNAPSSTSAKTLSRTIINSKQNSALIVSGIMINNGNVTALINNEIYEVGDYIEDKKITNITSSEVILSNKDGVSVLPVRRNNLNIHHAI